MLVLHLVYKFTSIASFMGKKKPPVRTGGVVATRRAPRGGPEGRRPEWVVAPKSRARKG